VKIQKAIITAAGRDQRALPLQSFVDRDGVQRTALRIILNEALSAGVEEIAVIICPGDRGAYTQAAGDLAGHIHFIKQEEPRGYGHALFCAREFVGDAPFLHMVSDHLFVSHSGANRESCAAQVVQMAEAQACAVSAVQATRESALPLYGTVGGRREAGSQRLYLAENVIEKPTPTKAEQSLLIPGLRAGHYLCFFGIHVLTPTVMTFLAEAVAKAESQAPPTGGKINVPLSPTLDRLAKSERMLALEVEGRRHNLAVRYGMFNAQLALTLSGKDRAEVLALLVEQLAQDKG
jgi:UTP--glucose-1-phosphate uridylyltransferase